MKQNQAMRLLLLSALSVATAGMSAALPVQGNASAVQQQVGKNHVKGRVLDKAGEPIIGATITVTSTGQKAVTDIDGNFTIEAPEGATIVVSYVGFQNQEFKARDGIVVTMTDDTNSLNEVVVTALGIKSQLR